ncbi:efflux RND transporter periplasmic adaptor subunit [Thiomicrospira cyclica]|uniref:Efflux transporter, RND family, MFP subunit n=1 Tax=Thiomicrospira cyclica (strain DSM 14477 / JCM 11371 / ALM1) TaxID=717773 RepID=F6DA33_THICA|nr:efflux RND transporter periplasmic adaptor subunit [Thiomicrospira cyclica]AEG32164.1 efflux transporter, RND family, MFP subunit [Thiomicrospira cyclica ALM1]
MKTYSLAVAGLVVLSLGLSGCSDEPASTSSQNEAVNTHEVTVTQVQLGTVPVLVSVPGSVVPDQQARIASRLMGNIQTLPVQLGDHVKRGDLLFTIDPQDINSQISQARAGFQQAQAALENARADFDRFNQLLREESVSRQQFEGVRLQYNVAQENLAAARAGLEQAEAQLTYANVRAPFDGVIVQKLAVAGDLAAPGNPIVVIENLRSLSVQTEVSQDLFAAIKVGDKALIQVDGVTELLEGEIYSLVAAANPRTRGHTTKLSLPSLENVNSGTFARISFIRGERQAILIPQTAVINRAGIEGVFVVTDDERVQFRMVRLGAQKGADVEVQAGLDMGESIVLTNNQTLVNGDRVVTQTAIMERSE